MCHFFNNELRAGLQDVYNSYAYAGILLIHQLKFN